MIQNLDYKVPEDSILTTTNQAFRGDTSYQKPDEEKTKSWFEMVYELVEKYPNDSDLGREIRKIVK